MKYFVRVLTDTGRGEQFDGKAQELSESELKDLRSVLEEGIRTFSMVGDTGETLIFPEQVVRNSIFMIVPVEEE